MSDKKISDLVELTTLAADDVLPVVDASANATKRVTYDTLATEVRTESEPLSATTVTASGDMSANTATIAGDVTSNGETVFHRGNVVGAVSQSGGTPTGAVVERDSNSNGEYVKFADGTMIAWHVLVFPGLGAGLRVETWTFPVPFISIPFVHITKSKFPQTVTADVGRSGPADEASMGFRIEAVGSVTGDLNMYVSTRGRWY